MSTLRLAFVTLPTVVLATLATAACGVPLAVSGAGYAADGGMLAGTNKTSTDHLISMVSKQDCALWRVLRGRRACRDRDGDDDPYRVDYADPQRTVSEDGVQYGPPLRPATGAPAASWEAAAYRPGPAPAAPASAVAETTAPVPAPVVAAPTVPARAAATAGTPAAKPAKPAKTASRSVRKPSRRRAAPGS